MKKYIILLIVGALIATHYSKVNDLSASTNSKNVQIQQNQLGEYQKEKERAEELKKLQDPTIIRDKINKVGKLTSLEGNYKYWSKITDKGLFDLTLREITLDFSFKFGIGISMEYINVYKVEGTTVFVKIPRNRMQLQYIQMNPESKIINDKKMLLVSQFKPSDVEVLIEQSQQNVVNKIGADAKIFDSALYNLQDELEKLIKGLGYYETVIFDEIV